jgi:hypothetical protein
MSSFTEDVARRCEMEFDRWANGAGRETNDPYCGYVGKYWSIGVRNAHIDGRTTYMNSQGRPFRPAWSSAFISFIYRQAGAGADFYYHEGHIHYVAKAIRDAREASSTARFLGRNPAEYAPKVGDLINGGRGSSRGATWANVLRRYGTAVVPRGRFIPSHSDIVVAVDSTAGTLRTIGGNVATDTVGAKTWALDHLGRLTDGAELITVIECTL